MNVEARAVLLRGAEVVLANSRHEPFDLVGLETMAVGGIVCTGASGEEYARAGENALVIAREDPGQFIAQFDCVFANPHRVEAMRRSGLRAARQYTWQRILERNLLPCVGEFDRTRRGHSYTPGSVAPPGVRTLGAMSRPGGALYGKTLVGS